MYVWDSLELISLQSYSIGSDIVSLNLLELVVPVVSWTEPRLLVMLEHI